MTQERDVFLARLVEWFEIYNRVCAAAQGDDDKPPPSWADVVKAELADWNNPPGTADAWDAYMRQTLLHHVESYLYALGLHPYQKATPTSSIIRDKT